MESLPVLYTFRRCPYAIRARMALAYAGTQVVLREVVLKDKPAELLAVSDKGTVPVLVLPEGTVLSESRDIMMWALNLSDPDNWLSATVVADNDQWLEANDGEFKHWLDRYKYADRYPEQSAAGYRDRAMEHLLRMNTVLSEHSFLHGASPGLCDAALFPFVRQFANVDTAWFENCGLNPLIRWLNSWYEAPLFKSVMDKLDKWEPASPAVVSNWGR